MCCSEDFESDDDTVSIDGELLDCFWQSPTLGDPETTCDMWRYISVAYFHPFSEGTVFV